MQIITGEEKNSHTFRVWALTSRIEQVFFFNTSYLAGLFDISYYFIFDRIVCVLLTFYLCNDKEFESHKCSILDLSEDFQNF